MSSSTETEVQEDETEPTRQELQAQLEDAVATAEAASTTARRVQQRVTELRETVRNQADRIDELEAENEELQSEVEDVRNRTALLNQVQQASSRKPEVRAAICIQTLYNEAYKRQQDKSESSPTAQMDYNRAEAALGGGMNREPIYRTFSRAEELVDNDDLVWMVKEGRASEKNTRLILDLSGGDVPTTIAGHEIATPEGGA